MSVSVDTLAPFRDWYPDISLLWPDSLIAVNAAVWEEVVFRGIVLTLLLRRFSEKRAAVLVSLIFSASRVLNLLFGQPPVVMLGQMIFTFNR